MNRDRNVKQNTRWLATVLMACVLLSLNGCGDAGQTVRHLHFHILGGAELSGQMA